MKFDIAARTVARQAYADGDLVDEEESEIIDTQAVSGVSLQLAFDAITGTDPTLDVTLEHGDESDLSDAENVPDDEITGDNRTFTEDDANKTARIGYTGIKRYVRATLAVGGSDAPTFNGAGFWVLGFLDTAKGHPLVLPVSSS